MFVSIHKTLNTGVIFKNFNFTFVLQTLTLALTLTLTNPNDIVLTFHLHTPCDDYDGNNLAHTHT
jgi:hypothetical protein